MFTIILAIATMIAGLVAAYAGYVSASRQAERANEVMKSIVSDPSLIQRFEQANNTVFEIQDGIRHGRLGQADRVDIFRKLKAVEETYHDMLRSNEARSI